MADLLTSEDHALVPGLTEPWLSIFFEAANSAVGRLAPCITTPDADPGRRAEAKLVVLRAIERVRQTPEFVRSQTAGPFSVTYITSGRGVLDGADRAALAALCDGAAARGGAQGSFPAPDDYDSLFVRPRARRRP